MTNQALRAVHATALPATAPEWVQLLPAGTFGGVDGRGPYTLRDAAAVIAESQRRAGGRDLPIDYGHELDFGEHNGVAAPASGWIVALEARDDGIWGRVEWTERGAAAVASRDYRYLSPVFFHTKAGEVVWIQRAGLTNKPNLALKALASEERQENHVSENRTLLQRLAGVLGMPETSDDGAVIARCSALVESETAHRERCEAIAVGVKLPKTASAEDVLAAVQAQAKPADATKFVSIEQYQQIASSLKTLQDSVAKDKAEAAVNAATKAGKLTPAQREWAIALHTQSPEKFNEFITVQPVIVEPGESEETRGQPEENGRATDDGDKAVCAALGISIEDYRKSREG